MKTIAQVAPGYCLALAMTACGASTPAPPSASGGAAPGAAPGAAATFVEQVAAGQSLYGQNCASCHGAAGEGKKAPPVVGLPNGALPLDPPAGAKCRKGKFKTVADVADFVVKSMPPTSLGSLTEDQYWDILAFDLSANGIDLGDKKLDATLAKTLEIPRK
jgi:cytochrome c